MTIARRIFCVFALAWSPDGAQLAVGGTGTTVRILDAATLKTRLIYRGHAALIKSLAWSPDGRYVVSAGEDHHIHIWSPDDGKLAAVFPLQWPQAVAWSPCSDLIAASSYSGTVELWKAGGWVPFCTLPGGAVSLAWSPDGRRLAAGRTGGVRIFTIEGIGLDRNLTCRSLTYALALSWAPDGGRLAVGGNNPEAVEIWDMTTEPPTDAPSVTYRGHRFYVWSVDWSPNSELIASGSWGEVHLWHPSIGDLLTNFPIHANEIYALAWSPDGTRIASGGRDPTIQVWNTDAAGLHANATLSTKVGECL